MSGGLCGGGDCFFVWCGGAVSCGVVWCSGLVVLSGVGGSEPLQVCLVHQHSERHHPHTLEQVAHEAGATLTAPATPRGVPPLFRRGVERIL